MPHHREKLNCELQLAENTLAKEKLTNVTRGEYQSAILDSRVFEK